MEVSTVNLNLFATPTKRIRTWYNSKPLPTFEELFTPNQTQQYSMNQFIGDRLACSSGSRFRSAKIPTFSNHTSDSFNDILLRNPGEIPKLPPPKIQIYQNFNEQKCTNQIVEEIQQEQIPKLGLNDETISLMNQFRDKTKIAQDILKRLNAQKKVQETCNQIIIRQRQFRKSKVPDFCMKCKDPIIDLLVASQGLRDQLDK
ncbi:hypothetical protein SS50377_26791 [Spironucleus salmonicida]|uniref:Uncharacterized protein n=1 Tax=Spironucleus salmonicida TaxID=348837 RepID=V6LXI5_9EUKA|nr:hypothetical protein SS50377_26791 [Spironucleus salmonicida]|eukprot:EST49260.1 Hypothetical protein SS50377_10481 [Spironucleus salmonicida]